MGRNRKESMAGINSGFFSLCNDLKNKSEMKKMRGFPKLL